MVDYSIAGDLIYPAVYLIKVLKCVHLRVYFKKYILEYIIS